jgi:hypothetical protein
MQVRVAIIGPLHENVPINPGRLARKRSVANTVFAGLGISQTNEGLGAIRVVFRQSKIGHVRFQDFGDFVGREIVLTGSRSIQGRKLLSLESCAALFEGLHFFGVASPLDWVTKLAPQANPVWGAPRRQIPMAGLKAVMEMVGRVPMTGQANEVLTTHPGSRRLRIEAIENSSTNAIFIRARIQYTHGGIFTMRVELFQGQVRR